MTLFRCVALWGVCLLMPPGKLFAEPVSINLDPKTRLGQLVAEREFTFYAVEVSTGARYVYHLPRSQQRYTPFSTFKIPHLLIALETGAVSALEDEKSWDSRRHPAQDFWPSSWRRSHTLGTAFKHSVPWYFKDVTADIPAESYRDWLAQFAYGNGRVPAGSDDFWLAGPLAISSEEQAEFIARLVAGQLDISAEMLRALKRVSLLAQGEGYRWYGKTGAGPVDAENMDGAFDGWLVGWVDADGRGLVSFALHVRGPSFAAIRDVRREAAAHFLQDIQALPH